MKSILLRIAVFSVGFATGAMAASGGDSFIGTLRTINAHASTVPANGDVNPYGVAVVPVSTGGLREGHVLVSNFNNAQNLQGTGTTIVQVPPGGGKASLFAQIDANKLPGACPGGVGLTTALAVLRSGWVIVGSLPTTDGTSATAQQGCLIVLDSFGRVAETITSANVNGPWDMTAVDFGRIAVLFVSNVLNNTVGMSPSVVTDGTVVRIVLNIPPGGMPADIGETVIASGFGERTDPNALVVGPTGVALGADGTLFVADTVGNRIAAISNALGSAGAVTTVSANGALNAPLGLAIAPNGDILTVNALDGNMVETTPGGTQVAVKAVDVTNTPGGGTLFGLAVGPTQQNVYFVNDGNNTLDVLLH